MRHRHAGGGWGRLIGSLLALAALALLAGCAQNNEPAPRMTQSNRGPDTPQDQRIVVRPWIDIQGVYIGVPSTQPADEHYGYASARTGSGRGSGSGFNLIMPIWVDASSSASPNVGAMNPVTGSQTADVEAEQRPETQVNPSLAVGLPGSAVTSSASGTAGFGSGVVSGAPNTVSPTQTPQYLNLRVPAQQLQTVIGWLQELFRGAAPVEESPPATVPAGG